MELETKTRVALIGTGDVPARLVRSVDAERFEFAGLRRSRRPMDGVRMHYGCASDDAAVAALFEFDPEVAIVTVTPDGNAAADYEATYLRVAETVSRVAGLAADRGASPCHLVFVSSTSVYGQDAGEEVDESSPTEPTRPTARVLVRAERAVLEGGVPAARPGGVRGGRTIVRFSGIYGPGRERLLGRVREGRFSREHEPAWTNRIHVDDAAGVLAFLLEQPVLRREGAGVLLASDREPALAHEVERFVARELGVPTPSAEGDARSGTAAADFTGARGKRCRSDRLESLGYSFHYPTFREGYRALVASRRD